MYSIIAFASCDQIRENTYKKNQPHSEKLTQKQNQTSKFFFRFYFSREINQKTMQVTKVTVSDG